MDHDSRGARQLAVEDADENDLVNQVNPAPVQNHYRVHS